MAKTIKFDLLIDGVKVATLDELREHFTTEIIGHFRSGRLARWLRSRGWTRELAAVEALAKGDDATTLKELPRILHEGGVFGRLDVKKVMPAFVPTSSLPLGG